MFTIKEPEHFPLNLHIKMSDLQWKRNGPNRKLHIANLIRISGAEGPEESQSVAAVKRR